MVEELARAKELSGFTAAAGEYERHVVSISFFAGAALHLLLIFF
jgi:hypothetical protein